jgi:hypothetical protein
LEYSRVLKTRKLLILLDAKNAEDGEIAPNWNVSGTRPAAYSTGHIPIIAPTEYMLWFAASKLMTGLERADGRVNVRLMEAQVAEILTIDRRPTWLA